MRLETEDMSAARGWTLAQATERIADPSVYEALNAAQSTRIQIKKNAEGRSTFEQASAEAGAFKKYQAASDAAVRQLRPLLVDGSLVSTGSMEKTSVPPTPIYRESWRSLIVSFLWTSSAREPTRQKSRIYNVKIFPLVYGPDFIQMFSGHRLAEAFRKCVLQDPEVKATIKRTCDEKRFEPILEGQIPHVTDGFFWPLDWSADRLASRLITQNQGELSSDSYLSVIRVAGVITDRISALRQRLMNGQVIARAISAAAGVVEYVDPLEWSRPSWWIDTRSGDILEEIDNTLVLRWANPTLQDPTMLSSIRTALQQRDSTQKPPLGFPVNRSSSTLYDQLLHSLGKTRRRNYADKIEKA